MRMLRRLLPFLGLVVFFTFPGSLHAQTCPSFDYYTWSPSQMYAGTLPVLAFNISNSSGNNQLICTGAYNFTIDPYTNNNFSHNYPNDTTGLGGQSFTCTIVARQTGCADISATQTVSWLSKLNQTITFYYPGDQPFPNGQAWLTPSSSSGLPVIMSSTTPSVCTASGNVIAFVMPGTCSITASQSGNSQYNAATDVTQSFSIYPVCPTINNFSWSPSTVVEGNLPTMIFNIANSNGAGRFACTGAYTVTVDPYSTTSYNHVWPNSTTGLGGQSFTCTITARQPYCPDVSQTLSISIVHAQTITFGSLPNQNLGVAPFSISATASSGLPVGFSSTTTGVCTVSGTTVSLIGAGTCSITATQSGNSQYASAPAVVQSFTVATVAAVQPVLVEATTFTAGCADHYCVRLTGFNFAANSIVDIQVGGQDLGTLTPTARYNNGLANVVEITLTDPTMRSAIDAENPPFNVWIVNPGSPSASDGGRQVLRSGTIAVLGNVTSYVATGSANGFYISGWTCLNSNNTALPILVRQGAINGPTIASGVASLTGDGSLTNQCAGNGNRNFSIRWPDLYRDGVARTIYLVADIGGLMNAVPNNININNSPMSVTLPIPANGAQFVSLSAPPSVAAGANFTVTVVYRNAGTTPWTTANNIALHSMTPQDNLNWGISTVALPTAAVNQGDTVTFTFTATAPPTTGMQTMQWSMVDPTVGAFGDPTTARTINVVPNPAVMTTMNLALVNSTQNFTITYINNTFSTWTSQTIELHQVVPSGSSAVYALPVSSVSPGQSVTFTIPMQLPSAPGNYTYAWQLYSYPGGLMNGWQVSRTITVASPSQLTPPHAAAAGVTVPFANSPTDIAVQPTPQFN